MLNFTVFGGCENHSLTFLGNQSCLAEHDYLLGFFITTVWMVIQILSHKTI